MLSDELIDMIAELRAAFLQAAPEAYNDHRFAEMMGSPYSVLEYVAKYLAAQQRWEPLVDGTLAIVLEGLERYQRQIGRAALQGWYKSDVAQNEIARIEEMMRGLRGTDEQEPTLAICRRQGGNDVD